MSHRELVLVDSDDDKLGYKVCHGEYVAEM
jgi:hypothetical protein